MIVNNAPVGIIILVVDFVMIVTIRVIWIKHSVQKTVDGGNAAPVDR